MSDFLLSYSPQQTRYEYPRIVAAAQALYFERGIEAVSLSDIAFSLRMPVGAIERHFPAGKPVLVQAVLEKHLQHIHHNLGQQREESSNAVEELLAMRRFLQQTMQDTRTLFFQELEVHYPTVWQYIQRNRTDFMLDHLQANMHRGMREGLYRTDLAVEALAQHWLQQADQQLILARSTAELAETYYGQLSRFLASLTTPAGAYVIRRLQEAPPYY
ncbi:TetR/AcrR family transcriptional regulator [Hymenobacter bucti]|uniref:TetR/AcrR family transcriptional regulator n=1 Tax=Hymenobacter bucti TaxID=1844114 RepID=A0ABW4QR31_9BACT